MWYSRQPSDNAEVYGTQLNGTSLRAPPWPEPLENKIMFLLPRELKAGDQINITGTMKSERKLLSLGLVTGYNSPDFSNVACQFDAVFPIDTSDEDAIKIKVIKDGEEKLESVDMENKATDIFTEADFKYKFSLRVVNGDVPVVDMYAEGSFLGNIVLKHNLSDIRFLILSGDVEKVNTLDFLFG